MDKASLVATVLAATAAAPNLAALGGQMERLHALVPPPLEPRPKRPKRQRAKAKAARAARKRNR